MKNYCDHDSHTAPNVSSEGCPISGAVIEEIKEGIKRELLSDSSFNTLQNLWADDTTLVFHDGKLYKIPVRDIVGRIALKTFYNPNTEDYRIEVETVDG